MLRGIKNATSNWLGKIVLSVLLGLIAISFAIWGVGDMFRGTGPQTVARIGNTDIRVEQFRQLYTDRVQQLSRQAGRPISPDQARALGVDRQLLAQTVAETVLDERARSLGLAISDAEIARRIVEDPNFRGLSGQFDRGRFEQLIRQIGYNEQRFLAETRRTVLRQQLVGTIGGDPIIPKTATDLFNRFQNEQRSVDFVLLGKAQAGDVADPTPEQLAKYYEERKVTFRAPEYRKLTVLELTPERMAATYEVPEADLRKAYEDRKATYETAEQRELQQIVFPNAEEAKAAADKIAQGASFEQVAGERGLKDADLSIGTVTKASIIDPAVAEAAFALKAGEVSAPVQGRFGHVILRAVKVEPGRARPLEEVAEELRRDVATARARNELSNMHDKIEDERLSGVSLAELAKKLNLQVVTVKAVDRSGRTPDGAPIKELPQNVDLLSAVFTAEQGLENEPLNVPGGGGYVWYEVAGITPARDRPLEEVKDRVEARWRDDEIARRLNAKSAEMLEKLKGGASLAEVAAADNLKVEWRPGLRRGQPAPNLPARAIDAIFQAPKDGFAAVDGASPQERIVFRVSEITVPKIDMASDEAQKLDQALRRAYGEELIAQMVTRLEKDVGVSINQAALRQVVGGAAN
jgi:peptidyl-prolyl cis-trans isomerase D